MAKFKFEWSSDNHPTPYGMAVDSNLYSYRVLIDAEGRCENYWLSGYVAIDTGSAQEDFFQAKRRLIQKLQEDGENVLQLYILERVGTVTVLD